jgi:hypothetical protein
MKRVNKLVLVFGLALVFQNVCLGQPAPITANLGGVGIRAQTTGANTNVVIRLGSNSVLRTAAVPNIGLPGRTTLPVTGTVLDPSGAPAPGVLLSATAAVGLKQNLKSDADGRFAFSWQSLTRDIIPVNPVIVERVLVGRDLERNLAATAKYDESTTNIEFCLQPGLILSGSVQDSHGAAVKTASVRLTMSNRGSSLLIGGQPATTDEQGAFNFRALPQGGAYQLSVSAPGFGSANVPVLATATQAASLQLPVIVLKPADQRLEGVVIGPDNKPAAGVQVRVTGVGQPLPTTASVQRTDDSGHFALKVCEGNVRVYVTVVPAIGVQAASGTVSAQSGDTNIVLKLRSPTVVPATVPRPNAVPANRLPPIGPYL